MWSQLAIYGCNVTKPNIYALLLSYAFTSLHIHMVHTLFMLSVRYVDIFEKEKTL